jgi:hypothetical protein
MKATKLVVHFEDGSTTEIPAAGVGSVYLDAAKAKKDGKKVGNECPGFACKLEVGHEGDCDFRQPVGDVATMEGGSCYIINGMVVCP